MKNILASLGMMGAVMACSAAPDAVETAAICDVVPRIEQDALITRSCQKLPGALYQPKDAVKGGIVLLHNFGDFHAAFDWLGPTLAENGYAAFAFDQRGFGASGENGRWYGSEAMIDDAEDALGALKSNLGGKPVFVLGESMGGSVAIALAAQTQALSGIILAAPGVREGIDYRWFWDASLWVGETFLPGVDVTNKRGQGDKLAEDARRRLSQSSKIVEEVRLDTYAGLIDLADIASREARNVNEPTLLLYGGQDDTIRPVAIENAEKALGADVTTKRYPDAPHLLFQSVYREQILRDTLSWLEKR